MNTGIMQRPPRPEPTRISPYFFKQLAPQHDSSRDEGAKESKTSGASKEEGDELHPQVAEVEDATQDTPVHSSSAAGTQAPPSDPPQTRDAASALHTNLARIFADDAATPHRIGAGTPAPIFASPTSSSSANFRDLQQVLWEAFTPAPYADEFHAFLTSESDVTERLRRTVAEAWASVEGVIQRNKDRRAKLDELTAEDAAWRAEVSAKLYWQSSDIVARYGLEVGGETPASAANVEATAAESKRVGEKKLSNLCTVRGQTLCPSPPQQPEVGTSSSNGAHDLTTDEAEEHVQLDFSVLQAEHLGSALEKKSQAARSASAVGEMDGNEDEKRGDEANDSSDAALHVASTKCNAARAKAWSTSARDLLDPSSRSHPLRRLFAPLQRQRATLPKWTTLLLNDVHAVQQAQLPALETRLQSSVLFKVPLHRPFVEVQAVLQACATQQRAAPMVEASQVTAFRQVEQLGKKLTAFVQDQDAQQQQQQQQQQAQQQVNSGNANQTGGGQKPAATSSGQEEDLIIEMGERWATAETLWTMLLTELDACKRFLAEAVPRCTALHDTVESEKNFVQHTLAEHRSRCETKLSTMKAEARTCAELLTRNGQRTLAAVAEMEDTYRPDQDRLQRAIAQKKGELAQLATQQEKNVRRVREALKACFVDQMKYEEVAQELLQDQLSLAQLEASHQQLRQAVQVRHEGAIESEKHAAALTQLLEDGDRVAHSLLSACDAHTSRIAQEDHFIQCRLVDQCTAALQQRCRCLHAIAALYDQRHAALEARAGGSWQLQFLLSGERDWAVSNLADVRHEFTLLEQEWAIVRGMRAALDMDVVELDEFKQTPAWRQLRSTLVRLDAPAALQRRLPTLRAHADSLTHPAAGCGSQAVRRLLTS